MLGVPDLGILGPAEAIQVTERVCQVTSLPVIVDGDVGYGGPEVLYYTVRRLVDAGASAICIEDAGLPKRNSFHDSSLRNLAPVAEMAERITAAVAGSSAAKFAVIARTEVLTLGGAYEEMSDRLLRYMSYGADAVVPHMNTSDGSAIDRFLACHGESCPTVVIPTAYELEERLIRPVAVVRANQILRSSVAAMQLAARSLVNRDDRTLPKMSSMADIDDLVGTHRIIAAATGRAAPAE